MFPQTRDHDIDPNLDIKLQEFSDEFPFMCYTGSICMVPLATGVS